MRQIVLLTAILLAGCATAGAQVSCGSVPRDASGQPIMSQVHGNPC